MWRSDWQQLVEESSPSNLTVKSHGAGTKHIFWYVWTVALTFEVWPWVKVMIHPWVMDNNCVNFRSNMILKSYGPDTFGYVCTVALTLNVWLWVKVMTHHWIMDTNCVKYYPYRTRDKKLWPGHNVKRRTDRRTDRVITLYPANFAGGIKLAMYALLSWPFGSDTLW